MITPPIEPAAERWLAGRYRLDRVIGRGAMGTVWVAHDDIVKRRVAIKEINFPDGMPPPEVALLTDRTMREARSIGALSHPHVITLYDILTVNSRPFIVMELLDNRSLAEVIGQDGPMPDGAAATIGLAVARGLRAAHDAGITHRDVKPGNVLVGNDGRIKLTDFGIARSAADATVTLTGILVGSPAYISPEVASGEPATPVADAWGLGALLFCAVEGRPPFDKGQAIPTLASVVGDPVPPHPHSGRLGPVIDGLLTKDPALRMTVQQAEHDLRGIADDPTGLTAPMHPQSTLPQSTITAQDRRAALRPPLPPPPWAAGDATSLPALPAPTAGAARARPRWLWPAAVGLAAAIGVGSFFGVRYLADLGEQSNGAPISVTAPAIAGSDVG